MAFPIDVLDIRVELLLGGVWTDVTTDVRFDDGIAISRGRRNEAANVEPTMVALTLDNRAGTYAWRNPESALYGLLGRNTPMRVSVVSPAGVQHWRAHVEIPEWPPRWTAGGADVWLPIQAAGLLLRMTKSNPPARDSIRRHVDAVGAAAYWPLTDGTSALYGTEVVAQGQPVRVLGPDGSYYQGQPGWGRGSLAPHLDAVVSLESGSSGRLTVQVGPQPDSEAGWAFDHVRAGRGSDEFFEVRDVGEGTGGDPQIVWAIIPAPATNAVSLRVESRESSGSSQTVLGTATVPGLFSSRPSHVRLAVAATDGAPTTTDYDLTVDGVSVVSGTWAAVGYRAVGAAAFEWDQAGAEGQFAIGHWVYWLGEDAPDVAETYRAVAGHDREPAGRRVARLCAEAGVELRVHGALDETPLMGPQRPGALMALLQAAAEVDSGTVGDARDALALEYRTGRSRYNQEATA